MRGSLLSRLDWREMRLQARCMRAFARDAHNDGLRVGTTAQGGAVGPRPHLFEVGGSLFPALAISLLLKFYYHSADPHALWWILSPVAGLTELVTGYSFELEPGQGYLCREQLFTLAPACAGVNFMVSVFLSLVLGLTSARRSARGQAIHLVACLVIAYVGTLIANVTRIVLVMHLRISDLHSGSQPPERLHEILGVSVYFLFLLVTFAIAQRHLRERHGITN